ncbi:acetyl-CoA carboxylase biotin carboxylase subunit [Alkalibacterium sp. 20]|uniref:acetyl-CoA carboxylase biotin carboxylase subunit n=1 Tax=Alkalibacterium sp. 20 TaxID=1798803 RepID=UPI00090028F6|nr:acetyl-CoA carboxylase biotin carboxylase subunit [Alkalibacterium sp. 20]OJF92496.1 acetyl-CoA carboxylase biotin carboxylase subunit [Alkalibacterium sp. 20]
MFQKILIANRGEIAVRIIRACQELNIKTVAVYSTADKDALHMQLADEAVCIGPSKANESYLNIQNILSAAVLTGAEAIHPGFGFLSENSTFAAMCEEVNVSFIGPNKDIIDQMGNKSNARTMMKKANVPVVPGSDHSITAFSEVEAMVDEIGMPVIIKAVAGGGGKGMRMVFNAEELEAKFLQAQSESKAAFGDDRMYVERIITPAKHIEVQILADHYGNVIHLGERDCSLQRNHQKILEEAPSPTLSEKTRKRICESAVEAAKMVGYENAGTIEFLVDADERFYFMEMNTRIQVEHPITEMITSIDIVKEQIKIAFGERLSITQDDVILTGHAIECRINAENPLFNFAPSPGNIDFLNVPSGGLGLRVDTAMFAGATIPPYYDAMVAKVITHGNSREEAISKMDRALNEMVIEGIQTNLDFHIDLLRDANFKTGEYTIDTLSQVIIPKWLKDKEANDEVV